MGDLLFYFEAVLRVFFVRAFRVCVVSRFASVLLLLVSPGAVWGALGGRWPLLEGSGEILSPGRYLFILGPFSGLFPPFQGGLGGSYV